METRQQRLLREALDHDSGKKNKNKEARPEATLRDKSLEHTDPDYVPRTLTPHEWEAYYAEHGVPREHRSAQSEKDSSGSLVQRLRRILGGNRDRRAPDGPDQG